MMNYYVLIWSVLIGTILIILFHHAIHHTAFLLKHSLVFFAVCAVLCILRFVLPWDFSGKRFLEYPDFLSCLMRDRYLFHGRILLLDFIILCFMLIAIGFIAGYHLRLRKIVRTFWEHSKIDEFSEEILHQIDPLCEIPVRRSMLTNTPLICGFLHPVIYLPYYDFSVKDLKNILLHESTHKKYHHTTAKYFLHIFILFFWWNPALRIFEKDMSHLIELVCDSIVLSQYGDEKGMSYIETIVHCLDLTHTKQNRMVCSAYFMGFLPLKEAAYRKSEKKEKEEQNALTAQRLEYNFKYSFSDYNNPSGMPHFLANVLMYGCLFLCVGASFFVMIQPRIKLVAEDAKDAEDDIISDTDNAYLVERPDGDYDFYFEGLVSNVPAEEVAEGYFSIYTIIPYEEYKESGDYTQAPTYQKYIEDQ